MIIKAYTKKEIKIWLEAGGYPVTILMDRYGGTYSGGNYVALPTYYWDIPADGPDGEDVECYLFWKDNLLPYGKGATPNEAMDNLMAEMKSRVKNEKDDEKDNVQ